MSQPKGYVDARYLQEAGKLVAPIKQRSHTLMRIQSGQKLLDLGCGSGIDTLALGQQVGPTGQVFGVDYDLVMVAQANEHAIQSGVSGFVNHQQGDATALDFASNCFDSCRSERLFMHLKDPNRAMQEMIRVTKPGGWLVILDTDWGSLSIDTRETKVERRLARFRAEQVLNNGYSGRRLYRMAKVQNLTDISLEIHPLFVTDLALSRYLTRSEEVEAQALDEGEISLVEMQRWNDDLEQADSAGLFFGSLNMVMVAGPQTMIST